MSQANPQISKTQECLHLKFYSSQRVKQVVRVENFVFTQQLTVIFVLRPQQFVVAGGQAFATA